MRSEPAQPATHGTTACVLTLPAGRASHYYSVAHGPAYIILAVKCGLQVFDDGRVHTAGVP